MKKSLIFFFLLFKVFFLNAQIVQTIFQSTYGKNQNDFSNTICETTDGGYIIAGAQNSLSTRDDCLIIKINNSGDTVWTRLIAGGSWENINSVQECDNTDILIVGTSDSYLGMFYDVYCARLNNLGNMLWYGGFGNGGTNRYDAGEDFIEEQNSNFWVLGETDMGIGGGYVDMYLFEINSAGVCLRTKTYGGTFNDYGKSIVLAKDGTIILGGSTSSFGAGNTDIALLDVDTSGSVIWSRTYGTSSWENLGDLIQDGSGNIVIVGSKLSASGDTDIIIVKTDSSGNLIWSRRIGGTGNDLANSVALAKDGDYLITGSTVGLGFGNSDAFLLKVNKEGSIIFSKVYGGTGYDSGIQVKLTEDDGYIISGKTNSFGMGGTDAYVVKTNRNGESSCNEMNITFSVTIDSLISNAFSPIISSGGGATLHTLYPKAGSNLSSLCFNTDTIYLDSVENEVDFVSNDSYFPNPTSGELYFLNVVQGGTIEVMDALGKLVVQTKQINGDAFVDLKNQPRGIYFYRILLDNKLIRQGKIILQ